ncbi:MAG TPA: asparagine--tRNA ligase [Chitinispirillaceae bacterium]|nr:asparagine--tRNA ligase [Chitinispirillaceae bacterium]
MNTISIKDLLQLEKAGDTVVINGWLRTRRDSKSFSFLEVYDGSCIATIQVIAPDTVQGYHDVVMKLATGASVSVTGVVQESPGKGQRFEVLAQSVVTYGNTTPDYPLQKKRHSFEFLREIGHLRARTNTIGAVMRVRSALSYAIHTFFQENGFFYVHTPIITTSDCEGAGSIFHVTTLDYNKLPKDPAGSVDFSKDFFERQAGLTVSGQLEGEAYALAMGKVYTFGPTFRAENSNTPRHLAEFWMVEPEAAFFQLADDMDLAERFVRYCVKYALDKCGDDCTFFNERIDSQLLARLELIASNSFERLSYTDAVTILEKQNDQFEYKVSWGSDLQSEHERFLTEKVFNKPVILFNYPKEIKAFYMRLNDDNRTVRAMDVLVPGIGELIGGSEREERYDMLVKKMEEAGLDPESYRWYLDLRRFGSTPHAGFGLGFERLLLLVSGMQNIRDVIPFPRYPGNAEF